MILETQNHLIFEMKKVKEAIKKKDSTLLRYYYNDLLSNLKVPSKDIFRNDFITLCSNKYSYHLLSCYLLLDLIDYSWDGSNRFFDRELKVDTSLMSELSVNEKGEEFALRDLISATEQVQGLTDENLYVFLVPYEYNRDYVIKSTYPGTVLIIYSNPGNNIENSFFEGVGKFYLKKKLKGKYPHWAKSEKHFIEQFTLWCNDEPSLFKKRKG